MHTTPIPRTDLAPSALCIGSVEFGSGLDRAATFALLDAYVAAGGNFIDTAKVYADWLPGERSVSEKTVGAWLKARGNRAHIILASKGAHFDLATPQIQRLAPADIAADLEASLRHLQTDVIDLYWLHRDDPRRPVGEIVDCLEEQVCAGKIRYYGASNWRADRLEAARLYAEAHGARGFCAVSNLWSLAHPNREQFWDQTIVAMDDDLWRFHNDHQVAAIPYTSQAYGVFHKLAAGRRDAIGEMQRVMFLNAETERRVERVQALSRETGLTVTQIVLGYLLAQPFPTIPVFSSRNAAQLADTLSAADVRLTAEQVAFLTS